MKKNFATELEAALYYDELVLRHRGPAAKNNKSRGLYTPEELATIASGTC